MDVPDNTIIKCCNCGFDYEIRYTKQYKDSGDRICLDCLEGDIS